MRQWASYLAALCVLAGCTTETAVQQYLTEILPTASVVRATDSCGGWLGLSPAVALVDVTLPKGVARGDLIGLETETGAWSYRGSLQDFVDDEGKPVGLAATVLDGKDCLRRLRADADAILFGPLPGLYFRSHDQSVLVILPDGQPGLGILFTQGR